MRSRATQTDRAPAVMAAGYAADYTITILHFGAPRELVCCPTCQRDRVSNILASSPCLIDSVRTVRSRAGCSKARARMHSSNIGVVTSAATSGRTKKRTRMHHQRTSPSSCRRSASSTALVASLMTASMPDRSSGGSARGCCSLPQLVATSAHIATGGARI
jgi:hypothetical protein